jgi:uncharacterized protein YggT (Ycf19 family)
MEQEQLDETREVVRPHEHPYGVGEGGYLSARIIYYLFGIIEAVLALRLIFRLLAANASNGFVSFIYDLSYAFVAPFRGIFPQLAYGNSVLEPSTLVAMLIYGLVAWGLVRFIYYLSHAAHANHLERSETHYRRRYNW